MQPSKNCCLCAYDLIISKVVGKSSGRNQQTIRSQASDFKYSIQQCQGSLRTPVSCNSWSIILELKVCELSA